MLLPHSWEEGCEIFLLLASSYDRNRSRAPFVRQVILQHGSRSQGRAGIAVELPEHLEVQVCRNLLSVFPPIFIWNGWKIGRRNLCHRKSRSNFLFEIRHSVSRWVQILLWNVEVKGAQVQSAGSKTYWSIFPSRMEYSQSQHCPMECFTLINQHFPMPRCSLRKCFFLCPENSQAALYLT